MDDWRDIVRAHVESLPGLSYIPVDGDVQTLLHAQTRLRAIGPDIVEESTDPVVCELEIGFHGQPAADGTFTVERGGVAVVAINAKALESIRRTPSLIGHELKCVVSCPEASI